jgi:hypothetical protein
MRVRWPSGVTHLQRHVYLPSSLASPRHASPMMRPRTAGSAVHHCESLECLIALAQPVRAVVAESPANAPFGPIDAPQPPSMRKPFSRCDVDRSPRPSASEHIHSCSTAALATTAKYIQDGRVAGIAIRLAWRTPLPGVWQSEVASHSLVRSSIRSDGRSPAARGLAFARTRERVSGWNGSSRSIASQVKSRRSSNSSTREEFVVAAPATVKRRGRGHSMDAHLRSDECSELVGARLHCRPFSSSRRCAEHRASVEWVEHEFAIRVIDRPDAVDLPIDRVHEVPVSHRSHAVQVRGRVSELLARAWARADTTTDSISASSSRNATAMSRTPRELELSTFEALTASASVKGAYSILHRG